MTISTPDGAFELLAAMNDLKDEVWDILAQATEHSTTARLQELFELLWVGAPLDAKLDMLYAAHSQISEATPQMQAQLEELQLESAVRTLLAQTKNFLCAKGFTFEKHEAGYRWLREREVGFNVWPTEQLAISAAMDTLLLVEP